MNQGSETRPLVTITIATALALLVACTSNEPARATPSDAAPAQDAPTSLQCACPTVGCLGVVARFVRPLSDDERTDARIEQCRNESECISLALVDLERGGGSAQSADGMTSFTVIVTYTTGELELHWMAPRAAMIDGDRFRVRLTRSSSGAVLYQGAAIAQYTDTNFGACRLGNTGERCGDYICRNATLDLVDSSPRDAGSDG